jgi:DNA-binding beta-propeller fold protein YncE
MKLLLGLAAVLVAFTTGCGSDPLGRSAASSTPAAGDAILRTVADVPLPGNTSRWDYQSLDPQSHRLFIAHLGAGEVVVYDTQRATVVATIRDVAGVHGVLAVPELRRVYASATDAQQIAVIDTDSLAIIGTVRGGGYPDGLAYAQDVGKVYVSDEKDGNETIIDAKTNASVGSVAVGGEAGNTQYDPVSHRVYVAVQTKNQIVSIDPATDQIAERHDTPGCEHPHGLLIDADQRRAFVACQGNNKLIVMEMPSMRVSSTHDVGSGPDVLAIDAGLHLVYVAAENGPLAVFRSDTTGVRRIAFQSAGPNAHSVAVDEQSHHVFLPLANVNGHPVLREMAIDLPQQF